MKKQHGKQLASMAIAGIAFLGLAACQPVPTTPGGTINMGGTTGGNATTTTAPGAAQPPATTAVPTTTQAPTTTTTAVPVNNGGNSSIPTPAGWRYAGGDEFNGTSVNGANWTTYHNNYGSSNKQLECETPQNVSVSGGHLSIEAEKQTVSCPGSSVPMNYTSGFLGSRESGKYYPRYARFEMRAKLPHAQGMWPAFWLRHRNGAGVAEVDIMEYFHSQVPGKTTQTLHLDGVSNVSKKTSSFEPATLAPGWHTWAVDVLPDPNGVRFTFYTDGVAVHTYVDTKHAWASQGTASGTWDIALNLAVGGNWVGNPDSGLGQLPNLSRCAISGTYPNCSTNGIKQVSWGTDSTHDYEVDYVRVYTPA
jgi:beta-glucanase (GH16 family)